MLKFGYSALKAMPKLFSYRNDVDIFTEDKVADKEFYRALFNNLFNSKIKVNDITPLGCKTNVLKAYDSQDSSSLRRKIFIVDGDLDLILGTNRKSCKNLVVLDSYCIENYLIEEKGALELIYLSNGSLTKEHIKDKLNFDRWLDYNSTCLVELFFNFAILRKYGGGPKIKAANEFLTQLNKQTILDKSKVLEYSREIKNEIILLLTSKGVNDPEKEYFSEYNKFVLKWKTDRTTLLKVVSGKDYLIPLLQFRINHCIDKGKALVPSQSFKLFLATNCKLDRLKFLKNKIK